jgi:hypothetical protein
MWWPRTCLIWPRNSARDAAQVPEPNQGTSRTPRVRSVKYKRHEFQDPAPEDLEAPLSTFVYDVPYLGSKIPLLKGGEFCSRLRAHTDRGITPAGEAGRAECTDLKRIGRAGRQASDGRGLSRVRECCNRP